MTSRLFKKLFLLPAVAAVLCTAACNPSSSKNDAEAAQGKSGEMKIAFFDLEAVLAGSDYANELRSAVEAEGEKVQKELQRRQQKLETRSRDLQERYNKGLLTTVSAQAEQKKLENSAAEFQKWAQEKEAAMMEEQQKMMAELADMIKTYVAKYNETKGYTMILSNSAGMPVVIAEASMDITEDNITGLNEENEKKKNEK